MELRLQALSIQNFKGIRDMTLNLNGHSAAISGRNGCGKSSIVDAFTWCLFGVNANGDSPGSDAFREKPLDDKGQIIHNLTTSVQLDFLLDGKPFNVKRELSESWVKRRGSVEPTFQGNVSKFFINDVELKKTEYEERISSIISTDTFKQIGILGYFNGMDWKKRRQYLMSLAGNDVDNQLLQNAEYKAIADEVNNRNISVDELKKVLSDQRKRLGNELKALPVRIDEAKKSIPTLKEHEAEDAEYLIADTQRGLENIDKLIIDTKSQGSNSGQIKALETELASIKRRMMEDHVAECKRLENRINENTSNIRALESKTSTLKDESDKLKVLLSDAEKERDALRKEFITVRAGKAEISDTCPTCGQPLPPDKVEEAQNEWEKNRKKRLLDIQTNGKKAAEKAANLSEKLKEMQAASERAEIELNEARGMDVELRNLMSKFPTEPDYKSNPRIDELEKQIAELESVQDQSGIDLKVRQLTERKQEMLNIIDRNKAILAKRDLAADNQTRIAEYENEMQSKGAVLSETELLLDKLDNFTQARCSALEDSINGKFATVRWKLFNEQINGGIVDCCTCMAKCNDSFVPYDSLNTASKIRSDIEISDVLMKHNDLKIPILLDNGERITDIPKVDTQMIVLSVSKDDELKVELL